MGPDEIIEVLNENGEIAYRIYVESTDSVHISVEACDMVHLAVVDDQPK